MTVTESDLRIIRTPWTRSGYRFVYEKEERRPWRRNGIIGYDAIVRGERLGRFPHQREAAKAVIQWFYNRYSSDWPKCYEMYHGGRCTKPMPRS